MASTTEKLDAVLQKALTWGGMPGVSAVFANSNGVLWEGQAGEANIQEHEPIRSSHIFGIGSITKVFVTVVALQLVEEQVLKITDTPGSILEPFVYEGIPNASTATISQLTSHTSGIPSWESDSNWIREGRGIDIDPSRIWGKLDTLEYVRNPRSKANQDATKAFPFSYSNTNFTLLGLMIEKVTGNTAETEIRKRVLEPLNMTSTYLEGFEEVPQPLLLPHRYHYATPNFREVAGISPQFPEVKPGLIDASSSNLSVEWAAGGMVSSPQDMIKFLLALKNGKLLNSNSMAIMQDWQPTDRPERFVGHGLFRTKTDQGYVCGHGGSVLGFTGSIAWLEVEDLVVAIGANVGTMHVGRGETAEGVQGASGVLIDTALLGLAVQFVKDIKL